MIRVNTLVINERTSYYLSCLGIAVLCSFLFYPGILSPDSVDQINQAVTSRYYSWHPAIMSIVMHYLHKPFGVGGIFILHQFLYWLGWALFFDIILQKRNKLYLLTGFFPPFFLISVTVWKDTGMMVSLFWASILFYIVLKKRSQVRLMLLPIFVLLTYAFSVRTNGFITVGSLIFFFIFASCFVKNNKVVSLAIASTIALSCVTVFFYLNLTLNKLYKVEQISAVPSLVLYDAAGTLKNSNLTNISPPSWATKKSCRVTSNWIEQYDPRGNSLCWTGVVNCAGSPKLNTDYFHYWISTIVEHPWEYLKHRLSLTSYLYGIRSSFTYFPFESHHYQNGLSPQFHMSKLGGGLLYIFYLMTHLLSVFFLYQPALYLLLSIYCAFESAKKLFVKHMCDPQLIFTFSICTSSVLSAFSLIFIAVAADYRYMIWTVLSGFISTIVLFNSDKAYNHDLK